MVPLHLHSLPALLEVKRVKELEGEYKTLFEEKVDRLQASNGCGAEQGHCRSEAGGEEGPPEQCQRCEQWVSSSNGLNAVLTSVL
mmetsp:Transcript_8224/g.16423  ORF Transcript_8224/g.16423 Transcript_8224/m.16423 type:complete len:85 (-) Transcript_8224:51-305(-)